MALLWFNILVGRGKVLRVSTGFSYHYSPEFVGQKSRFGVLPFVEYVYSNYAFWNFENNHGVVLETH